VAVISSFLGPFCRNKQDKIKYGKIPVDVELLAFSKKNGLSFVGLDLFLFRILNSATILFKQLAIHRLLIHTCDVTGYQGY